MEALGIKYFPAPVTIGGYVHDVRVSPRPSHFADINIRGNDFCGKYNVSLGPKTGRSVDVVFDYGIKWDFKAK